MERYDTIGQGYSERRIADRRIAERIRAALGSATSAANIGAGTGSYEPESLLVIPIEPSPTMIVQRPAHLAQEIRADAEVLPLADDSLDAVMAVLTVYHWSDVVRGIREMQRVARDTIAIVTIDTAVSEQMWLLRDYMPQMVRDRDRAEFPSIPMLTATLGESTTVRPIPVPSDCTDGFLLTFWSRPSTRILFGRSMEGPGVSPALTAHAACLELIDVKIAIGRKNIDHHWRLSSNLPFPRVVIRADVAASTIGNNVARTIVQVRSQSKGESMLLTPRHYHHLDKSKTT